MAHDVPGAPWPEFMLQVQEIRKPTGTPDRYYGNGKWRPPAESKQRGSARINSKLFYCDTSAIHVVKGPLNNQYKPLPPFSIYYSQREILAFQGDVLKGLGALGPTVEDCYSDSAAEPEWPWKYINFKHSDHSSFVGIAGDEPFLKEHNPDATWARRLIPKNYRVRSRATSQNGLNGHIQLLLGLLRLCEDPQTEAFTTSSKMETGRWRMSSRTPERPEKRGVVIRVWALPEDNVKTLENFGEGVHGNVFS